MSRQSKTYFWLTILLTTILIFFFYGKIITSPNQYLMSPTGDGFTAYFNTTWHIELDSSNTHFTGSNYPYGEHTVYSEYRLLISNSIKALGNVFPAIKKQNIAITNLSIILSILICAIFMWLIFKELGIRKWLAVTATIGITFLAPQVGRFDNHLTLAYLNCFPMTWFFLIKYFEKEGKWKWSIALLLNNASWFFVHSYLGLLATMFTGAFWLVWFLKKQDWKNITSLFGRQASYLHFGIQTFLPPLFFLSYVKMTDIHEGRTENPLGFLLYNSEPDDIFIPHHPPLRPLLNQFFNIQIKWESWAYVGLLTSVCLLFLIFHFIKKGTQQKRIYPKLNWMQNEHLKIALPASLLCLIFAFGFPFKAFPVLLDWLPLIKNFRTTGRFGWIFYFVSTVSVTYVLHEYLAQLKAKQKSVIVLPARQVGWFLISILPLTYLVEGFAHHYEMSKKTTQLVNVFDKKNLEENYLKALGEINSEKYQAIIPLPFYYCGSEHFSRPIHDRSSMVSKIFSYHTQIPLLAFDVGRTSISESKKIVQTISPTFYKKLIVNDLPSEKPFLVVVSDELSSPYEEDLKDRGQVIYGTEDFKILEISKANLLRFDSTLISDEFGNRTESDDELSNDLFFVKNNIYTSDTSAFFFYENFENEKSEQTHFSQDAFQRPKRGEHLLTKFSPHTFEKNKTYALSAWFFNGQNDALNDWFRFIVEERNPTTGQFKYTTVFPEFSEVINGDWSLVEMDFHVDFPENEIWVITIGKKWTADISVYIDDLWIREKGVDIFENQIEHDGKIYVKKNNHIQLDY